MARHGDTVSVLAMQHDLSLPQEETIRSVSVYRACWVAKISKGFLSWEWIVRSWRLVREHDAVVVNLPQFEGMIPALMAKLRGKRLVTVYHCEISLPDGFFHTLVQSLMEVSHFLTLLLSDAVVTYTDDYAKHSTVLSAVRRVNKHLTVHAIVPPIPELRENTVLAARLRKRIGKASVVIGVAARLAAEKGMEYLFDAIPGIRKHIKDGGTVKIAIAGPMEPVGEAAYKARILRLVQTYAREVVFLGAIDPGDMGAFYRCIDVLVLPSVNSTEAFGLVQVEAMNAGIPVVASDLPGVRVPIARTGMGILVPPRDSRALAKAINTIVERKVAYVRSPQEIRAIFSPEQSIQAFESIL